jgi:hypothetical protein
VVTGVYEKLMALLDEGGARYRVIDTPPRAAPRRSISSAMMPFGGGAAPVGLLRELPGAAR